MAAKVITVNGIGTGSIDTTMNPENGLYSAEQKAGNVLGRYCRP